MHEVVPAPWRSLCLWPDDPWRVWSRPPVRAARATRSGLSPAPSPAAGAAWPVFRPTSSGSSIERRAIPCRASQDACRVALGRRPAAKGAPDARRFRRRCRRPHHLAARSDVANTVTSGVERGPRHSLYEELAERSTNDVAWFWDSASLPGNRMGPAPDQVLDESPGLPGPLGSSAGSSTSCATSFTATRPDRAAVSGDPTVSEGGEHVSVSYAELDGQAARRRTPSRPPASARATPSACTCR